MRRAILILVALSTASCTYRNRTAAYATAGVGGAAVIGGLVVTAIDTDACADTAVVCQNENAQRDVGIVIAFVGFALLVAAQTMVPSGSDERPSKLDQAQRAAQHGDCSLVYALDVELSFDYVQQPSVSRCIEKVRVERAREQAWTLTKAAQRAARQPNCEHVAAINTKVAALDAEFHADVFMRDAAILRCVSAPR